MDAEQVTSATHVGHARGLRRWRPDRGEYLQHSDSLDLDQIAPLYAAGVRDQALYLQDKWTPVRKLVINVGLRYESPYGPAG
jgi:hypothetical protein